MQPSGLRLETLGPACSALLQEFASTLKSLGVDVPKAVYVGSGEIPWDGESLTLYLGSVAQGQPGRPFETSDISPSMTVYTATVFIQLLRTVSTFGFGAGPQPNIPKPSVLDREGQRELDDVSALIRAAIAIKKSSKPIPLGEGFSIAGVMPVGPEGGLGATRLQLHLSVS